MTRFSRPFAELASCFSALLVVVAVIVLPTSAAAAEVDGAELQGWGTDRPVPDGPIVIKVVMVEDEDEDPMAAGKAAAEKLKAMLGNAPLRAVIVSECFEDRGPKQELLKGVCSVLPPRLVVGGATYGSFTQAGCSDFDSVCLLGIAGEGVGVEAALVTEMGTSKLVFEEHRAEIESKLRTAGAKLARRVARGSDARLLVLIPDAHSPKNQYLVEGAQQVVGKRFPITGGCANKNAGQTFVYFGGRMYQDAAVALMLSGDFKVSLAGRQAKDNDRVISTANDAAQEALGGLGGKPLAAFAFNCAGRRSKLKNMDDELAAMQKALGKDLPLFGCYCAGEIGPVDAAEKQPDTLSGGSGWHVMFTILGR